MEIEEIVVRSDQIPLVAEWLRGWGYWMLVTDTQGAPRGGIIFTRFMDSAQIAAWGDTLLFDPQRYMVWVVHHA